MQPFHRFIARVLSLTKSNKANLKDYLDFVTHIDNTRLREIEASFLHSDAAHKAATLVEYATLVRDASLTEPHKQITADLLEYANKIAVVEAARILTNTDDDSWWSFHDQS
jgi:hypothetical protein